MVLTPTQINALLLLRDHIELEANQSRVWHSGMADTLEKYRTALNALRLENLQNPLDPQALSNEIGAAGSSYYVRAFIILGLES